MSKEAKSGELEKEFSPPFHIGVGSMLPLTDGGMYLTTSLDASDPDEGVALLVARVDAEGNADVGFGVSGIASAQIYMDSTLSVPMGVMQGSDGKITAAVVMNRTIGLARFTPKGDIDSTFGNSGTITHVLDRLPPRPSGVPPREVFDACGGARSDAISDGEPRAVGAMHGGIVPAPGGGMYFVRDNGFGGPGWSYLVRFNALGLLDRSFDDDGVVYVQHPDGSQTVALAVSSVVNIEEGSKVVVAGWVGGINDHKAFVARFDKNGQLDTAFGEGGFAVVKPSRDTSSMLFGAVYVTRDGRIFASGQTEEGVRRVGILVGLDTTGKPLLSFNQGEPVLFDLLDTDMKNDFRTNVAVQADGKIVVVGQVVNSEARTGSALVARYLPDGSLDSSFAAPQGWITINPFGRTDNWVFTSELAPDGKIVLAGGSFDSTSGWVVRLSS